MFTYSLNMFLKSICRTYFLIFFCLDPSFLFFQGWRAFNPPFFASFPTPPLRTEHGKSKMQATVVPGTISKSSGSKPNTSQNSQPCGKPILRDGGEMPVGWGYYVFPPDLRKVINRRDCRKNQTTGKKKCSGNMC